jgi:biotin synthase
VADGHTCGESRQYGQQADTRTLLGASTVIRRVVYETGNRTVDDAVRRVLDGERLDRRDGLALIAQPVDALAA